MRRMFVFIALIAATMFGALPAASGTPVPREFARTLERAADIVVTPGGVRGRGGRRVRRHPSR